VGKLEVTVKSALGADSCCVGLYERKSEVGLHNGTLKHEDEANECNAFFHELNEGAVILWTSMERGVGS
jgi:hypothetical protein